MATWGEFAASSPALAERGRALLYRTGRGTGMLSTVRGSGLPRINPISLAIVEERLVAFIIVGSQKALDLADDGRYALHAHLDPNEPDELLLRGRARPVDEGPIRAAIAATWSFEVDDSYRLFEFLIDHAVLGERASPRDWPPRYTSWRDAGG